MKNIVLIISLFMLLAGCAGTKGVIPTDLQTAAERGAANVYIGNLTADTSPTSDDLVESENDPSGTPSSRKVTFGDAYTKAHGLGNWKVFYTNGSGVVTALTLGANGTALVSNGATSAPSFGTVSGTDTIGWDYTARTAAPTGGDLIVGKVYRANNDNWDPITYAGTTDYFVLWTGTAWVGIVDIDGKLLVTGMPAAVEVDGSASISLTAAQVQGTIISNYGQAASDVALTFPTASAGLSSLFDVGTAQSNKWGVRAGTNDKIYLIAADGTISAGTDNGYARMTAAQVGQSFACWTIKTGASAWDWACKAISIGTSTFAAN